MNIFTKNINQFSRQNISKNTCLFKKYQQLSYKPQNNYFFLNKDKFIDPKSKKIRIHEVSKYSIGLLVGVSWIFIMKWWYTAEDRAFEKAQHYLQEKRKRGEEEVIVSQSQMLDEEYRTEYIEKTKRKYQKLIKQRQQEEMDQRQKLQQAMGLKEVELQKEEEKQNAH